MSSVILPKRFEFHAVTSEFITPNLYPNLPQEPIPGSDYEYDMCSVCDTDFRASLDFNRQGYSINKFQNSWLLIETRKGNIEALQVVGLHDQVGIILVTDKLRKEIDIRNFEHVKLIKVLNESQVREYARQHK